MKPSRLLVLGVMASLGLGMLTGVREAHSLPPTVGGFFNLAGMRMEDFAALPETWEPGAKLKATWELWKSPEVIDTRIELQRLTVSAVIFGLEASEVTVQMTDERILRFDAVFKPARGATVAQLEQTLRRNLEAWADSSKEGVYRGGASVIEVMSRPREDEIVVTFGPAVNDKPVSSR